MLSPQEAEMTAPSEAASSRIGDPMTREAACQWLASGQSPAGTLVSGTRARRLTAWARDAGAVHLTAGPDLNAPGQVLTFDGTVYEVFPAVPAACAGKESS
jgi:hypothetical protein